MQYHCPICEKPITKPKASPNSHNSSKYFPFCSDRCRLIDLGAWLDADYRIPVSDNPEDEQIDGQ